jgi:uncharacterized protein (TIGR03083 family)
MPTSLTFAEHLEALDGNGKRLADLATAAGMSAPVPTCPAWNTEALVAHLAMVHRWATAHVRNDDPDSVPNQTEIRTTIDDLVGYYRDGHTALVAALADASPDTKAMTFLNDAPAPRHFWARRQAHETTIHMVDALAASLGRLPTTDEAGVETALAVDGIDELLRGFFTRGRSKLYDGDEYSILVRPTDSDRRWTVRVAERLTVEPGDADMDADAIFVGSTAGLYLALWNRGDQMSATGRADVLAHWQAGQRIRWS